MFVLKIRTDPEPNEVNVHETVTYKYSPEPTMLTSFCLLAKDAYSDHTEKSAK